MLPVPRILQALGPIAASWPQQQPAALVVESYDSTEEEPASTQAGSQAGTSRCYRSLALGDSLTSLMADHPHSRNVDLYINRYDPA
jgi:hypothetical protein